MQTAAHGQITHQGPPPISNRLLGLVLSIWLAIFALWPLIRGGSIRGWGLWAAAGIALVALLLPGLLAPLNHVFRWFSHRVGLAVQTVVTALLFALVFVPLGLIMRRGLRERLGFVFDRNAESYWTRRKPPEIAPDMRRQF